MSNIKQKSAVTSNLRKVVKIDVKASKITGGGDGKFPEAWIYPPIKGVSFYG
ncbi:acinetodin/klebsidin/J25 family lasso peptide [Salmonella enterica]|nr:acinetodin/klebsidin/J25 family lasso peptide [Salmonella enterica subsp. enterica serovar Panama]EGX9180291.1 acinetodin/klebsidin/J25 family lasso peptide [Salmonella enterica]EGZ6497049.1 acinetodin/klebsidin/J25 family lasso peptide [Salmonella enterica]